MAEFNRVKRNIAERRLGEGDSLKPGWRVFVGTLGAGEYEPLVGGVVYGVHSHWRPVQGSVEEARGYRAAVRTGGVPVRSGACLAGARCPPEVRRGQVPGDHGHARVPGAQVGRGPLGHGPLGARQLGAGGGDPWWQAAPDAVADLRRALYSGLLRQDSY